jgi:hypothetical protein
MAQLQRGLEAMLKYFKGRYGSKSRADETMRLALFIFDDQEHVLRRIAEAGVTTSGPMAPFEIPMGEGVTYRSFRRPSVQVYRCPALQGGLSDGIYLYWPEGEHGPNPDYAVLAAFPMMLPAEYVPPPQETIGVYSVWSDALDSGLPKLFVDRDEVIRLSARFTRHFQSVLAPSQEA